MSEHTRILYVCSDCHDNAAEMCGHIDNTDVRVMPDGRWLCDGCYDDERHENAPLFHSLPPAPRYVPAASEKEADSK